MTYRDLFTVSLRLLTLYFFFYNSLMGGFVSLVFQLNLGLGGTYYVEHRWSSIAILVLLIVLMLLLLIHAERLVGWFRLDKGFEDKQIDFGSLSQEGLMSGGVFIIGALMALFAFPEFISNGIVLFKQNAQNLEISGDYKMYFLSHSVQIVTGLILMFHFRKITSWFYRKKEVALSEE